MQHYLLVSVFIPVRTLQSLAPQVALRKEMLAMLALNEYGPLTAYPKANSAEAFTIEKTG